MDFNKTSRNNYEVYVQGKFIGTTVKVKDVWVFYPYNNLYNEYTAITHKEAIRQWKEKQNQGM